VCPGNASDAIQYFTVTLLAARLRPTTTRCLTSASNDAAQVLAGVRKRFGKSRVPIAPHFVRGSLPLISAAPAAWQPFRVAPALRRDIACPWPVRWRV
jgi:hypothetical protein